MFSNWEKVPFRYIFERISKRTGHADEEMLSVYRDYGVIRKSERDDNFNKPGESLSAYQLVEPGDLVLNKMKTWQGSLGISKYRGIVSPAYFVYRSVSADENRFLQYALRSDHYIAFYKTHSKGIRPNQWDLIPEDLDQMKVALPSIPEQQRIADFLDVETGEIDRVVGVLDELIEDLEARSGELVAETLIGDEAQIRHYASIGPQTPEFSELAIGDEVTYMPLEAVHLPGREDYSNRMIWKGTPESYNKFRKGDILAPKVSPTFSHGRTMIADIETDLGLATSEVFVVRSYDHADPRFVRYLFHSRKFISEGVSAQQGVAGLQRVSALWIGMYRVPLLELDEQRRIADYLDEETSRIDTMKSNAMELREELLARRRALITEYVTGQKRVG